MTFLDLIIYGLAAYGLKSLMVTLKLWVPFIDLCRKVLAELRKEQKQ
jgi:hypothetical protein